MLPEQIIADKWLQRVSLFILFACVALFAYTGNYIVLAVPFGLLFAALMVLNWKTAYWVLLFSIPASTQLFFMDDTLSTSLPDEPMMWLFFGLFIILLIRYRSQLIPTWWWRNPIVFIITLQFLWLIVAVIYSQVPFFSIKFLLLKAWYLVDFLIIPIWIFREKKDFKKAFFIIMIPLVATMLIILYRHSLVHFSFRKIQRAIRGIYYNHVDYSTVISMFFPLLFVAWPLIKHRSLATKLVLLGLILFFIPAIYLTYARAAILAIVFAGVIALAMRLRLVNYVMPVFYGLMALMLVYLIHNNKYIDYRPNFEHTYMRKNFEAHIVATFRGQDMSSMERLYRWIAGIRMSVDKPITGYGPHAFYYFYKPYAVTSFKTYVSRNTEHSTTHNYFLFMLVEQGWPAMILYALLIMVVFAQAQKIYWRFKGKDKFYACCTMGLIMVFAAGFINNFFSELIETHKVGSLFYLAIALLIILEKKSRELEDTEALDPGAPHADQSTF